MPNNVYTIAIRNPAPGIEGTIADEISRRSTLSDVRTIRCSDQLAMVSYTQQASNEAESEQHINQDQLAIEGLLASYSCDYIVMSGLRLSENPIDQIILGAMGYLAAGLVHHHQEIAVGGELPKPNIDYQFRIEVAEIPGQRYDEFSDDADFALENREIHCLSYRMPVSKTVASEALLQIMSEKGIESNVYIGGWMGGPTSEQTLRILIKEYLNWSVE